MKKKLLVISLIAIVISVIASGTLAFFTADDSAKNVFTSGGVSIEVEEWQVLDDGSKVPYPETAPIEIMPGDVVSKFVTVKSAEEDVYVRATLAYTVYDANGDEMNLTADEIAAIISLDINNAEWSVKDPADGYYYYNGVVGDGDVTDELFTEVTFATSMDNRFQHCTVEIDVLAEAVQAKNNGTSALDCAWN